MFSQETYTVFAKLLTNRVVSRLHFTLRTPSFPRKGGMAWNETRSRCKCYTGQAAEHGLYQQVNR